MSKIASVLSALILAVSLAACGGEATPDKPQPTVTVTAEPETPEPESQDEVFLGVVRDEYPVLEGLPDSQLVELATSACEVFDAGASARNVVDMIMQSSSNPDVQEAMAFTVGAGVGIYCPEHTDKFDTGLAS